MAELISIFVSPVVEKVIDTIASFVHKEFLLARGVHDAVENLSSTLQDIRAVLNDAEEKQLGDPSLRNWLAKLKDGAYDAEDVLDAFGAETFAWKRKQNLRSKICIPFRPGELSFAHKIKEISERLDTIAQKRQNFQLSTSDFDAGSLQGHPLTDFFVDPTNVFGREKDKEEIIKLLLSENSDAEGNVSVIPIFGMGGIGKSTLAQLVFNDKRVDDHFTISKMWVCVTADFNMTRILREIMASYEKAKLSPDITDRQMESRFRDFMSGKRCLVVLDDVWTEEYVKHWEPLLQLLQLGRKGSKVLVTTRNLAVSKAVGTLPPCYLGLLSEEDGWLLFEKMAFKRECLSGRLRSDLEAIGKQIVAKCQGLPLAVKAMGGLLWGNVDVEKWKRILASEIWQLEDRNNTNTPNILPALKLSYNHLPSHLKQLFAFCSIFPKAYVINKKDMVKLWMAQGFIQSRGQVSAEDVGGEYFDDLSKLVNLEFLELDDMFWFKCTSLPPRLGNLTRLHDLHAFKVGRRRGYQIVELKRMEFLTGALRISNLENAVNAVEANLNGKQRLQKLVLEWTSRDVNVQDQAKEEKVLKDLQPQHSLEELHISHYKGSNFPHWIRDGTLQNLSTFLSIIAQIAKSSPLDRCLTFSNSPSKGCWNWKSGQMFYTVPCGGSRSATAPS